MLHCNRWVLVMLLHLFAYLKHFYAAYPPNLGSSTSKKTTQIWSIIHNTHKQMGHWGNTRQNAKVFNLLAEDNNRWGWINLPGKGKSIILVHPSSLRWWGKERIAQKDINTGHHPFVIWCEVIISFNWTPHRTPKMIFSWDQWNVLSSVKSWETYWVLIK